MDFPTVIEKRRSVRGFLEREVEFEKLGNILEAARLAPSSGNIQDTKFIVVYLEKTKEQLVEASVHQEWMGSAPIIIVVCADTKIGKEQYGSKGELYSIQNAACATQNILLAAVNEGLGACWVGAFDEDKVKSILEIKDARPLALVPIGYFEGHIENIMRKELHE